MRARCPFCGARVVRVAAAYDECRGCDILISRLPPAPYDATYYYAKVFRSTASLTRANLQWRYFKSEILGRKCLDFGCNDGAFVLTANRNGACCFGADINESVLSRARVSGGGEFFFATDVKERFSCVTAFDVVEHFDDPQEFFGHVGCWLESNGLLIITTPNKNSKWRHLFGEGWHGFGAPEYHRFVFSSAFLRTWLEHHDYLVEREFSVPPVELRGWRLLVASGYRLRRHRLAKAVALPSAVGRFLYGRLVGKGEEDTLCLVARRA